MKILHTSDWHLGQIFHNYSREIEQQSMLDQITEVIKNEKPDALLISGDVYDTTQPSAAAQKMFADSIVGMHNANPEMKIFCIAGNHDSGSKHMIFQTPWLALGVHVLGSIVHDSNLEDYIFKIEGKGYVVAVPFATDRFMPDDVFKRMLDLVAERNAGEQLPVFVMGHLAIAQCNYRGHDQSTDDYIGGLNCQALDIFGDKFDYAALGHIHKEQTMGQKNNVRYSGTPVAVSFDEIYQGNRHGVSIVSCDKHGEPVTVTMVDINCIRPLVNIPADGFDSWENVISELRDYPDDIPAYIRINVQVDKYLKVGALDEARMIAGSKQCRVCLVNATREENRHKSVTKSVSTEQFKELDQSEILKMWTESKGSVYDDDLKNMFNEVKQSLLDYPENFMETTEK